MTVKDVKDTLANEVELLDHMIKCVKNFDDSKFTKEAKYIKRSWRRFLGDRRSTNVQLKGKSGKKLKADLQEELSQVKAYESATVKRRGYSELWPEFLDCERKILKHLKDMIP